MVAIFTNMCQKIRTQCIRDSWICNLCRHSIHTLQNTDIEKGNNFEISGLPEVLRMNVTAKSITINKRKKGIINTLDG